MLLRIGGDLDVKVITGLLADKGYQLVGVQEMPAWSWPGGKSPRSATMRLMPRAM